MASGRKAPVAPKVSRRAFLRGATFGMAGSVVTGAYADYSASNPRLETLELKLKRWKVDGLRVGFITDIHVNDPDEVVRAQRAAQLLADAKPDVLLFGGDCLNTGAPGKDKNVYEAMRPFHSLKCPKIAVLGNHDYWSDMVGDIERALTESGFLVLKNEVVTLDGYSVAGYDDRIGGKKDETFQPRHESLISLMHEPDHVTVVPDSACLQLSGHSHGGQICFPFGFPVHTPLLARRYSRGYYPDANVPLYVSRGVGTTGFKWRMFCPPEVTLLTLRSAT